MSERKRLYCAGAYSGPDVITVFANMRRGLAMAAQAQAAGFAVYAPWTDILLHLQVGVPLEKCYANAMAWLEASDAVLVEPFASGQSVGTQAELKRAVELGIPVFSSLNELEAWAHGKDG